MSASEKLKALEASDESPATDMLVVWDALPQIVAVVEAAEAVEFQQHEPWSPEYQDITDSLAALEEALS